MQFLALVLCTSTAWVYLVCGNEVISFSRYPVETLSERIQQLHEASVGYPRSEGEKEYQPPTQYRIAFVKYIIKQVPQLKLNNSSSEVLYCAIYING